MCGRPVSLWYWWNGYSVFVAPLLDNYFRKIKLQIIIPLCVALMMIFVADQLYTKKHPNVGEGITCLNIYDMYYYL